MTVHKYTGPSVQAVRRAPCRICGQRMTKRRTFSATVNPFNKRADGTPKTFTEVLADVQNQADAWQPDPKIFTHTVCLEADDA